MVYNIHSLYSAVAELCFWPDGAWPGIFEPGERLEACLITITTTITITVTVPITSTTLTKYNTSVTMRSKLFQNQGPGINGLRL